MSKNTITLNTEGSGGWTSTSKPVTVIDMQMGGVDTNSGVGRLLVSFDPGTWDVEIDGHIMGDELFLHELKEFLNEHGLDASSIDYADFCLHTDDCVVFDVSDDFLVSWEDKFNVWLREAY